MNELKARRKDKALDKTITHLLNLPDLTLDEIEALSRWGLSLDDSTDGEFVDNVKSATSKLYKSVDKIKKELE